MANIKSAQKRIRQNEKRRLRNASQKSALRTHVKKFEKLVEQKDLEGARKALSEATKRLDRAATKGVIHKNAAARKKSLLMKALHKLENTSAS